jgi:hypothetical protein
LLAALHGLRLYVLLLGRFQRAFRLGLRAHPLDGVHYVLLLRKERIAKVGRPLNVVGQTLHEVRQCSHGLHARVPGLLAHGIG